MDALRFAATKIQPPRRARAASARPALDAALARALRTQRLVLLQAPAGFGKTSALAAQLARLPAGRGAGLGVTGRRRRRGSACSPAWSPRSNRFDLPWRSAPDGAGGPGRRRASRPPARAAAELLNALAEAGIAHGADHLDDLHRLDDDIAFAPARRR